MGLFDYIGVTDEFDISRYYEWIWHLITSLLRGRYITDEFDISKYYEWIQYFGILRMDLGLITSLLRGRDITDEFDISRYYEWIRHLITSLLRGRALRMSVIFRDITNGFDISGYYEWVWERCERANHSLPLPPELNPKFRLRKTPQIAFMCSIATIPSHVFLRYFSRITTVFESTLC